MDLEAQIKNLEQAKESKEWFFTKTEYLRMAASFINFDKVDLAMESLEVGIRHKQINDKDLYNFAKKYDIEEKFSIAVNIWELAIKQNVCNGDIFFDLADYYFKDGNINGAIEVLEDALNNDQKSPHTFHNLSDYYYKVDEKKNAIEILKKGLKEYPDDIILLAPYGIIYYYDGDIDKAINIFEIVIDIYRDKGIHELVVLQSKDRSVQRKNDSTHDMKELYNILAKTYSNLGYCYDLNGEIEKSIDIMEEALNEGFKIPLLYINLSNSYYKNNELKKAIKLLEKGLDEKLEIPEIYLNLSKFYQKDGDDKKTVRILEKAINDKILEKAINDKKTNSDIYNKLMLYYQREGNLKKAVKLFNKSKLDNIKTPFLYKCLAELHFINGDTNNAIDIIKEGTEEIDDIELDLFLAYYHAMDGDLSKSIAILEDARKKDVPQADILRELGIYYYHNDDNHKAKDIFKEAFKLNKEDSSILRYLYLIEEDESYIEKIINIVNNEKNRDYRAYLYLSEFVNEGKVNKIYSKNYIHMMVNQMKKNNHFKYSLGTYKETKKKIKIVKGDTALRKTIIVKQFSESFKREKELRDKLENICIRPLDYHFSQETISNIVSVQYFPYTL